MNARLEINLFSVHRGKSRITAFLLCKLNLIAAVGVHSPDLIRAGAVRSEKNVTTVGRDSRRKVGERIICKLALLAAVSVNRPNISAVSGVHNFSVSCECKGAARGGLNFWIVQIAHLCKIQTKNVCDVRSKHFFGG